MPTYEYLCKKCEHEFEQLQSITAKALRKCPQCGKMSLKRLIGAGSGVIFKGSGFYETDYRSESYKKAAKSETSTSGSGGSGTEGKSKESKPKAKEKTATSTDKKKTA
ncbi:MAG: FmdB family zinc ribbon protein [Planctomycetota bacterium]|jgi:putative FmdB family regulatory protein